MLVSFGPHSPENLSEDFPSDAEYPSPREKLEDGPYRPSQKPLRNRRELRADGRALWTPYGVRGIWLEDLGDFPAGRPDAFHFFKSQMLSIKRLLPSLVLQIENHSSTQSKSRA